MQRVIVLPFDMLYTQEANKIISIAFKEAGVRNFSQVETQFFLLAFLREGDELIAGALKNAGVELNWVLRHYEFNTRQRTRVRSRSRFSALSLTMIGGAFRLSDAYKASKVTSHHLFLAFLELESGQGHHVLCSGEGVDSRLVLQCFKEGIARLPSQDYKPPGA